MHMYLLISHLLQSQQISQRQRRQNIGEQSSIKLVMYNWIMLFFTFLLDQIIITWTLTSKDDTWYMFFAFLHCVGDNLKFVVFLFTYYSHISFKENCFKEPLPTPCLQKSVINNVVPHNLIQLLCIGLSSFQVWREKDMYRLLGRWLGNCDAV